MAPEHPIANSLTSTISISYVDKTSKNAYFCSLLIFL